MQNFRILIEQEKNSARLSNGNFNSMHEIYGVLAEELFELFQQMILKPEQRDPENVLQELVQISAVAEMAAEDLYLVEKSDLNPEQVNLWKEKYDTFVEKVQKFLSSTSVSKVRSLQKNLPDSMSLLNLRTTMEAFQPVAESEECQNISL